ncbi:uncharacterized protein LOC144576716 isoform X2 [Callithrix jacchus]
MPALCRRGVSVTLISQDVSLSRTARKRGTLSLSCLHPFHSSSRQFKSIHSRHRSTCARAAAPLKKLSSPGSQKTRFRAGRRGSSSPCILFADLCALGRDGRTLARTKVEHNAELTSTMKNL